MANTLIVRDATLAINGAPEARCDARDHLRLRVAEVQVMDPETLAACAEVLRSSGSGENVDVDRGVLRCRGRIVGSGPGQDRSLRATGHHGSPPFHVIAAEVAIETLQDATPGRLYM